MHPTRLVRETHYEILGLSRTATAKEIKRRFFELSKKYHPDKTRALSVSERQTYTVHFRKLKEAYEVLSDRRTRQNYDLGTGSATSSSSSAYSGSTGYRRTKVYQPKRRAQDHSNTRRYGQGTGTGSHGHGRYDPMNPGHRSGSNYDVAHFDFDKHLRHQQAYELHRQKREQEKEQAKSRGYGNHGTSQSFWTLGRIATLASIGIVIFNIWR